MTAYIVIYLIVGVIVLLLAMLANFLSPSRFSPVEDEGHGLAIVLLGPFLISVGLTVKWFLLPLTKLVMWPFNSASRCEMDQFRKDPVWIIKTGDEQHYFMGDTIIGPMFNNDPNDAHEFRSKVEAEIAIQSHPAFQRCNAKPVQFIKQLNAPNSGQGEIL